MGKPDWYLKTRGLVETEAALKTLLLPQKS